MKTSPWDRAATVTALRRDVWRFITEASTSEREVELWAAALLRMRRSDVRALAAIQFLTSEEVGALLHSVPAVMRRLTTTTTSEVEISPDRIRGPIRWGETLAHRAASGRLPVYVTAPTLRVFDTPENRVLAFALRAIATVGRTTGWAGSLVKEGSGADVRRRVGEAMRWSQARSLVGLGETAPTPTDVRRCRSGRNRRRYAPALAVVDLYNRFVARLDRDAIRRAVQERGLVVASDDVLLELRCTFDTIRALRKLGWEAPSLGLLRPPMVFDATRGSERVRVFYQHAPAALKQGSLYRELQLSHGMTAGGLIPDLVLEHDAHGQPTRWIMVEIKGGTQRRVQDSARAAARDLLTYRRSFAATLAGQTEPYGLGYAWGLDLQPMPDGEILLCTPDTLEDALAALLPAETVSAATA